MEPVIRSISFGWELKQEGDISNGWLPVEELPSEVHDELVRHGRIADPFVDLNELSARWVSAESWRYRTRFAAPQISDNLGALTDLVFEGLDTFATVWLNGEIILQSSNMFIEHRVDIGEILLPGQNNTLEILFEPARRRGLELVEAHTEHDFIVHQTEVSRGPVRKAQYHWGWDWGPILLTSGPWKPVRLETWRSRIGDIRVDYLVSLDREVPEVDIISVSADIFGEAVTVEADLFYGDEHVLKIQSNAKSDDATRNSKSWEYSTAPAKVPNPRLWWPRGYGAQDLYVIRLKAIATDGFTVLATRHQVTGFRRVELVQEVDNIGKSFYFRVNNIDIFSGGSCWIPADSILSRITPDRYRSWIKLVAEGNQNMVRVWGGGIYEADVFYSACDELGVMVWQDFMFACASYPTYPEFLASVETEARQAVHRLGPHPSVILWCGNNEDYQLIERYGLEYQFNQDKDPASWLRSTFPARYIYEDLLPRVVAEETSGSVYHPGSPWGNGTSTTLAVDATVGDIHQWNVWHGDMKPYQKFGHMGGRFVSEFGMEAYPHLETIHKFVSKPGERYPGSMTMDFHNKAVGHQRRLLTYVGENFRLKEDLPSFAQLTQIMQADAVSSAFKSWRRQWGGPGDRRCGGVLVWQLNDCWPTVSWAVVDYFLVKKPAYYAIKRAMAPLAIGVSRKFHDWTSRPADKLWRRDTGHVNPIQAVRDTVLDVWVASSRLVPVHGEVVVKIVSVESGEEMMAPMRMSVTIQPNACTDVLTGYGVAFEMCAEAIKHFVVHVSLEVDGAQVSTDTAWPDPLKYLDFANRMVKVERISEGLVQVAAKKPVKGFVFSEEQGVELSDNGFDLLPGEEPTQVFVEGLGAKELSWTFVGQ